MKHTIPILLALTITNMSCGNSKKESSMNEKNQNLTAPITVGCITTQVI